jgi:hypothetical protein
MSAGFGLVFAAVDRPAHGCMDELFGLVTEVEQASDLGQAQTGPWSRRWVDLSGVALVVVCPVSVAGAGCVEPPFSRGVVARGWQGRFGRAWLR